jgi:hypothetical protein
MMLVLGESRHSGVSNNDVGEDLSQFEQPGLRIILSYV